MLVVAAVVDLIDCGCGGGVVDGGNPLSLSLFLIIHCCKSLSYFSAPL